MDWDRIKGNWEKFSGKAKRRWGKLTDDDLDAVEGQRDALAGRIQERYGIGKDEAEREIEHWARSGQIDESDSSIAGPPDPW